jgi:hypothetical protein
MEGDLKLHLQAVGAAFMRCSGLSYSAAWLALANDASFMKRIEGGGSFTLRTYDQILARAAARIRMDGGVWPEGVPRPQTPNAA